MNGKEILIDTNIIIYLLDGSDTLAEVLQGKNIFLSFITELELIGYKGITNKQQEQIEELLGDCSVISMNNFIKDRYIQIRKKYSFKLAYTLIAATSLAFDIPLLTADIGFKKISGLRLITYQHEIKLADSSKD